MDKDYAVSCRPIGIIDSGIGGISVLNQTKILLPNENWLYLSDMKNAPYGTKSSKEIIEITRKNVKKLIDYPCKAIVIACNTATAAAIEALRAEFPEMNIVGLEPAIRPAVRTFPGGNILVLATEATLHEKRFFKLLSEFQDNNRIACVSAQKLVSFVEEGMQDSVALISYLKSILSPYKKTRFSACVLGCTHFPFAKKSIETALGYRPVFFDGGGGAAERLKTLLLRSKIKNPSTENGSIIWLEKEFSEYGRKFIK